jgi:hypothetical protein
MARHKQDIFTNFFTDEAFGIDLGNVEIKYSSRSTPEYVVKKEDLKKSNFLVFYSQFYQTWYFINTSELPIRRKKNNYPHRKLNPKKPNYDEHRSFNHGYILKHSYLTTSEDSIMMNEMEQIVKKPKKYLKWLQSDQIDQTEVSD